LEEGISFNAATKDLGNARSFAKASGSSNYIDSVGKDDVFTLKRNYILTNLFSELETGLDFQLQDSNFEFVAAIRAHTNYWRSSDVALFIMKHVCLSDDNVQSKL
jgi:hypothetical protein